MRANESPNDHSEEEETSDKQLNGGFQIAAPHIAQTQEGDGVGDDQQFNAAVEEHYGAAEELEDGY